MEPWAGGLHAQHLGSSVACFILEEPLVTRCTPAHSCTSLSHFVSAPGSWDEHIRDTDSPSMEISSHAEVPKDQMAEWWLAQLEGKMPL